MDGIALVNTLIFAGSALVLIGIFSSLVATRFGMPLLLVFLVVGMLAGEDGPGQIHFDNFRLTYLVGSMALAVILFDGGLRTRRSYALPADQTRWVASRKAAVVNAVAAGLLSREEVIQRYQLSEEEFDSWVLAVERYGKSGLKVTSLQKFRHS